MAQVGEVGKGKSIERAIVIPYVDSQLAIWGKWTMARASKGLGYPSVCPMFKDARHGGAFGSAPPVGVTLDSIDHILDTDAAVQRLSDDYRRLAIEFYAHRCTAVEISARLGIGRQRLYERLHAMHQSLLGHINDVVANS